MNRTHRDIKAEILDYALHHKDMTISKMFYKGELSWSQVSRIRKTLVSMDMVHTVQKGVKTFFFITVKGREWLSLYTRMTHLEGSDKK